MKYIIITNGGDRYTVDQSLLPFVQKGIRIIIDDKYFIVEMIEISIDTKEVRIYVL